jgi:hypothetical protein
MLGDVLTLWLKMNRAVIGISALDRTSLDWSLAMVWTHAVHTTSAVMRTNMGPVKDKLPPLAPYLNERD